MYRYYNYMLIVSHVMLLVSRDIVASTPLDYLIMSSLCPK